MKKIKYVGKVYNLFIVSIIAIMIVSIIITALSAISFSSGETSLLVSSIEANNNENTYYSYSGDTGVISAPNYATSSNVENRDVSLVGANYVSSNIAKFSLADYIPLNTKIKDQGRTSTCWTFSTVGSVQTNLALKDYLNDKPAYEYDFSERHVTLSSIETSSNKSGYNRNPIDGATYWMAMNYYTRAAGPVLENESQFSEDDTTIPNNSNTYNLNKAATVTDIKQFAAPAEDGSYTQDQINEMKTFIRTKGSLCATMFFPTTFPNTTYNTSTGASYVNSNTLYTVNHMISIIGWDDNYSKDNFNSSNKPRNNGAWLVRNSHGNHQYTDNGYLHISYEDKLLYDSIFGIENVDLAKDYTKVVGYSEKGSDYAIVLPNANTYTLFNVFDRNKSNEINEFIDSVSLYLLDDSTVSIAIAEGDYNTNKNLIFTTQSIKNSTSAAPGFRTFNLTTPYKFNTTSSNATGLNNKITVKVTINTSGTSVRIPLEGGYSKSYVTDSTYTRIRDLAGTTKTETGKCFLASGGSQAVDLGNMHADLNTSLIDSDSTVQLNLVESTKPTGSLVVKTNPNKTHYEVGENFNPNGLSLKYNAGHGSTLNIDLSDCILKKNTSLTDGQTYVEVYGYGTKVNVPITVGNYVEMTPTLTIKTNPTKTSYYVGDNFNSAGLVLNYTHGNQSNPTVDSIQASSITITDGTNLKENQTYITAKYNDLTVQIPITVQAKPVAPTFNDTNNLKNMAVELTEYKINTKNNSGFDSFKVSLKDITENTGATYKYYYYISNTKEGTGTRNEINTALKDGILDLNIDTAAAGSSFKLNAAGDAIYLTIIQANKTANTEVSKTIQVEGNSNTKIYVNGQYIQDGTTVQGETEAKENITTEIANNEVSTKSTVTYTTNSSNTNSSSKTTPISSTGDTTVAKKKIPQTGTAEEILKIVIISIILIGGAFIIKTYIIRKNMSGK